MLIISLIISIFSFILSICTVIYNKRKSAIITSLELAEKYQSLLWDMKKIDILLKKNTEIYEIISKPKNIPKYFTAEGIEEIYSEDEISKLKEFFEGKTVNENEIIIQYELKTGIKIDKENKELIEKLKIDFNSNVMLGVLNKLEYIAMGFNHSIAYDKVVYQSLHQSFFRIVRKLYYLISCENKFQQDYYYMNIESMYIRWKERYEQDKKNKPHPKIPNILSNINKK